MIKKKAPTKKAPPKKKTAKTAPKKKIAKTAPKASKQPEPNVTILKTSRCQSLSGKSTLTFNVGLDEQGGVCLRVTSNSGGGFFSREAVPLSRIDDVLSKVPDGQSITSFSL